jgi:flagellar basal-body rod protein FlgG
MEMNGKSMSADWQGRMDATSYDLPTMRNILDFQPGKLRQTGNKLDIAIKGNGLLEVNMPNGVGYTRAGSLSLDASGRLVTSNGLPVSGVSGEIRLGTSTPTIDKSGVIWDGDDYMGQLKIVQLKDTSSLIKQGDGLFVTDSPVIEIDEIEEYEIYQGYVEASNVNMMNEMVNLIEAMRHIESTQKMISVYDEMMSTSLSTITEV